MSSVPTETRWNILYRGSLSSCNYDCAYCPFAKTTNTRPELDAGAAALARFVEWVGQQTREIGVLFTPWGEAMVHRYYQRQLGELSHYPHVRRVAVQTNLSGGTSWLADADLATVALWTTYHPSQISRADFLAKCAELDRLGARYSVGMVGLRDDLPEIEAMRASLDDSIYLWVNAYKDEPGHYIEQDIDRLTAVDPLFPVNLNDYASRGQPCRAGHTSFTVDHEGTARRCHFIEEPIGNIFDDAFADRLQPSDCTKAICDCHIGYVHRPELGLYEVFGEGLLERIPDARLLVRQAPA